MSKFTMNGDRPRFRILSSGYYVVDGMKIVPRSECDAPRVNDHVYAMVEEDLYDLKVEPITFRDATTGSVFQVDPSGETEVGELEVPRDSFDRTESVEEHELLLARPGHARALDTLCPSGATGR